MTILSISNLGKSYNTYASELVRFARWFGLPVEPTAQNWILKNISFDLQKGESIGIVGKNGAGKSTLLKMLTGVLQPTEGALRINGNIAAILELGMGFNPDLTARQNVSHTLGLMGHSHSDITNILPEIESFAEIGDYFDQPMRTYSSGMQMRVAFAAVTAFRPDILIVDEALSVGDAYFQHKSFDKIRQFKELGTSLLIVSHDASSIKLLCDKVVLLQNGSILMEGKPEVVMDYYNASLADHQNQSLRQIETGKQKIQTVSGTGEATIEDVQLLNEHGDLIEIAYVARPLTLVVKAEAHANIEKLVLGFSIKNRLGQVMFGTNTFYTEQIIKNVKNGQKIEFKIDFIANFGLGTYSIQLALTSSETHLQNNYEWRDMAYVFEIVNIDKPFFIGMSWLNSQVRISS